MRVSFLTPAIPNSSKAPNVTTTFFLDLLDNPVSSGQEDFMDWILYMLNHTKVPLVQSLSYDDQEYSLPISNIEALNVEFQKAGLRGISLLFAAGDDGVGGYDARTNSSFCSQFNPTFPGSSPYVTSVGGTQLSPQPTAICGQSQTLAGGISFYCDNEFGVGEAVCSVSSGARCGALTRRLTQDDANSYPNRITTGGGFSNVNGRPSYQARNNSPSHRLF